MNLRVIGSSRINTHKMVNSEESDINVLWHRRYTHLCFLHLSLLSRFKMADSLPDMEKTKGRWLTCSDGKQHREDIDMGASKVLELTHVEVCGPTRTPSLSSAWCILRLLDDFSQKSCVLS
jgi:hypothetical protein